MDTEREDEPGGLGEPQTLQRQGMHPRPAGPNPVHGVEPGARVTSEVTLSRPGLPRSQPGRDLKAIKSSYFTETSTGHHWARVPSGLLP